MKNGLLIQLNMYFAENNYYNPTCLREKFAFLVFNYREIQRVIENLSRPVGKLQRGNFILASIISPKFPQKIFQGGGQVCPLRPPSSYATDNVYIYIVPVEHV
jgi:hypothetical protein